jgi:putative membrane protein
LQHMVLVAIAAPLIAAGLAGRRFDPVVRHPGRFAAIPASLVELVVVWGWHAPALHDAARLHTALWAAEQSSFLAAGLYFWLAVVGGTPQRRFEHTGNAIIALVLTFSHMTLLGAILVVSRRPLYAHDHAGDAVDSQHLGGAVMLVIGGLVYIGTGLWLARRLVRRSWPRERSA